MIQGDGDKEERRGRIESRNVYKGPMNMDSGVGINCGMGEEQGRATGEYWNNCN